MTETIPLQETALIQRKVAIAGWMGGLSPFMITARSIKAGNALSGLWYPVGILALALTIGVLFLPGTRNVQLDE